MKSDTIISRLSVVEIIRKINNILWNKFESEKYQNVKGYISRWHEEEYDSGGELYRNFQIITKSDGDKIDLLETLHTMNDELILKIAVDLNIEVPGLIYSVAEIKGVLSQKYEDAARTFEKAHENIYSNPSAAIGMAYSALEHIIKKICSGSSIDCCKSKDTLYRLTIHILKQFNFFPDAKLNTNIRNIGSGLLTVSHAIENIRSNNTEAHGREGEIISDSLYAMLVVNAVAAVGLFLMNYYDKYIQT